MKKTPMLLHRSFFHKEAKYGNRKDGLAGGKVTECPVDTLLGRGRFPLFQSAAHQ
jgi:hypothetical protein